MGLLVSLDKVMLIASKLQILMAFSILWAHVANSAFLVPSNVFIKLCVTCCSGCYQRPIVLLCKEPVSSEVFKVDILGALCWTLLLLEW